ncbi:flagellar hook protein FlgE [Azospirillaceae bacterium]
MTVFGAMATAVLGMNAQARALGHISDNIANAQTIGYKRVGTSFEEMVLQSDSQSHTPGGVRALPAYSNNIQGTLQQVESRTNVALQGNGMFNVSQLPAPDPLTGIRPATTKTSYFTRVGDFELDKDRYLVNSAGYALNGWEINTLTGTIDASTPKPIQVAALIDNPVATSEIELVANLPAKPTVGQSIPNTTIQTYDTQGNSHTVDLTWRQEAPNVWRMGILTAGSTLNPLDAPTPPFPPDAYSMNAGPVAQYNQAARSQVVTVPFVTSNTGSDPRIGDVYRVTVNGTSFSSMITLNNVSSLANADSIVADLAGKINGAVPPTGVLATTNVGGQLVLTAANAGTPFTYNASVTAGNTTVNTIGVPAATSAQTPSAAQGQVVNYTLAGSGGTNIDIGDTFDITVNGVKLSTLTGSLPMKVTSNNIGTLRDLSGVAGALVPIVQAALNTNGGQQLLGGAAPNTVRVTSNGANVIISDTVPGRVSVGASTSIEAPATTSTIPSRYTLGPNNVAATITQAPVSPAPGVTGAVQIVTFAGAGNSAAPGGGGPYASFKLNGVTVPSMASVSALQAYLDNSFGAGQLTAADNGADLTLTGAVKGRVYLGDPTNPLSANSNTIVPTDGVNYITTSISPLVTTTNVAGSTQMQSVQLTGSPGDAGTVYTMTVAEPTHNSPSYFSTSPVAGTVQDVRTITFPAVGSITAGETFQLTVNGVTYPALAVDATAIGTPITTTERNRLAQSIVDAVNNDPISSVSASWDSTTNKITLSGSPNGTPMTTSASSSSSANTTFNTNIGAYASLSTARPPNFAFTDAPSVGESYEININGTKYALLMTADKANNMTSPADINRYIVGEINKDTGCPMLAQYYSGTTAPDGATSVPGGYITLTPKPGMDSRSAVAIRLSDPTSHFRQTVSYTSTGNELTLTDIASALASRVNAAGNYVQATAPGGGVISLNGRDPSSAFVVTVSPSTAVTTPGSKPPFIGLEFGQTPETVGTLVNVNGARIGSGTAMVSPSASTGADAYVSFKVNYGFGEQLVKIKLGQFQKSGGLTQYAGSQMDVASLTQNGSPRGQFQNVAVNNSGEVVVNYDNGRAKAVAVVPIGQFNNPNALKREDGGVYTQTLESGQVRFNRAGTNGAGQIVPSSLEASNVDMADEFTKLIVTQRTYSANTKIITTSDEMLQEVIGLKR